jgi:glc operon protein GlcG
MTSPLTREQRHVTLAVADVVLSAAVEHAESLGVAAVIVVTDAAGGIVRLARLDGAPPMSIRHALGKASSASGMGRTTDEFLEKRLTRDDVLWRAISGRGDARAVGAIGVASARHERDTEIAAAGAAVLDG